MSEEWKAQYNKAGQLWFWGLDVQENPGAAPEARSCLCVLSGFLPHDLCHRQDSSHRLPAVWRSVQFSSVAQSCLTLSEPFPFHTIHGVSKSRILKWFAIPFSSGHILSEFSTMTRQSWVALHRMAHSFIELDKAVVHVTRLLSFL